LTEIGVGSKFGKWNFFGEKFDGEYISFGHGGWKIAFPAAIMIDGRTNVPTHLTVLAV
jgi:hypothetical protein